MQTAMEAASKAIHRNRIANAAECLASIHKRFIDKSDEKRLIPVGDEFLEDLVNSVRAPSFEDWMQNRVILKKLLKLMDANTRRICHWRLEGYSEFQIAKRLGISRSAVSVRFGVRFKEAAKELLRGKRGSKGK